MDRFKYYVQIVLVLMGVLFPLFAFSSAKQNRYDYPFIVPVVHPIGQGTGVIPVRFKFSGFYNMKIVSD